MNIHYKIILKSNGNRTKWSPIWSVIIRVKTKSDDRVACLSRVLLPINHKNCKFREKKNSQVMKERENLHQKTDKGGVNC